MQQTANLVANIKTKVEVAGRHFLVLDTGAAADIELWIFRGNDELEYIRTAKRGFKARVPDGFTHLMVKSAVGAACEFVISNGVVDFDFISGTSVNATIVSPIPLPVSNDRGTPGNLMHVSAVTVADTPAVSLNEPAAIAVDATVDALVVANANRRRLVFTNIGTVNDVAIGSTTITWAKRAIVLRPGDTWVEERAANLAWSAICDAAKSTTVTVQEVLT